MNNVSLDHVRRALDGDLGALFSAFVWADSPQRHEYWENIVFGRAPLDDEGRAFLVGLLVAEPLVVPKPTQAASPRTSHSPRVRRGRKVTRHYTVTPGGQNNQRRGMPVCIRARNEFIDGLTAEGYQWLGAATRAVVLFHPENPDVVVRVGYYDGSSPLANGTEPVDGWVTYFEHIISKTRSAFAPKVYSVDLYPGFYVVRMERLWEADPEQRRALDAARYGQGPVGLRRFIEGINRVWLSTKATLVNVGGAVDLHPGNIMQRANGQLVVTDPYCMWARH